MKKAISISVAALMLLTLLISCKSKRADEKAEPTTTEAATVSSMQPQEPTTIEFVPSEENSDLMRHNSKVIFDALSANGNDLSPYFLDNSLYAMQQLGEFGVGKILKTQTDGRGYRLNAEDDKGITYGLHFSKDGGLSHISKADTDGTWSLVYDAYVIADKHLIEAYAGDR